MATKAELEGEVALLRRQNEALRSKAEQPSASDENQDPSSDIHLPAQLSDALKEHGIDASDVEALGNQLVDEVTKLHKDHPLITLLGVFLVGCIVGRAFR